MPESRIEWTEMVWNPVTGCTPVSRGCEHCYAKRMATRLAGRYGYPADEPFAVTLHPDRLTEPLRRRKPTTYFVCSMGDLFHELVPTEFIDQVFAIMLMAADRYDGTEDNNIVKTAQGFQVLTKRPQRMREYLTDSDAVNRWFVSGRSWRPSTSGSSAPRTWTTGRLSARRDTSSCSICAARWSTAPCRSSRRD